MNAHVFAAALGLVLISAVPAGSQTRAWGDNGYLGLNGIYQEDGTPFAETFRLTLNQEDGSLTAGHRISAGPAVDVFGGGRVVGLLGFGFGVSYFQHRDAAGVSARLPHPFFFDQHRAVDGDAAALRRQERAIHADAMLLLPVSGPLQVILFAGPSYFKVAQDMVTDVQFAESYPYDTAQFVGVETLERTGAKLGYNVGADICLFLSRYVGVGTLVRFSRARIELASTGGGTTVSEAGGLQVGGGLRVRF